jgi:two-component system sensor histidine kinase MprB
MSLRTRLALALGLVALVVAVSMALVGYHLTSDRLTHEVDASLSATGDKIVSDRDGRTAAMLCGQFFGPGPNDEGLPVLPGVLVRCIDPTGTVAAGTAPTSLPVTALDLAVAEGSSSGVPLHTVTAPGYGPYRAVTVPIATGGAVQVVRSLEENEKILDSLRSQYAALAAAVTAAAALLGWLIARRTTKPITALTTSAETIAETGELDIQVPAGRHDETGRLARSFGTMVEALRRSREQQHRLVEDAGHELRTPLTSLRTNVDTLRRHPGLDEERRQRILVDLDSELRELTTLTNELVALATEKADDDEPVVVVDVAELVARSARRVQRRTGRHVLLDAERSLTTGHVRALQRVTDNLLDNAAKFSPPDAAVDVTVRPGVLMVRDHGPGIADADLPHLFERFYRATASRSLPGSGLGLSIVHDTVVAHGGTVSAANAPGGGAVFTVTLPRVTPPGLPDPTGAALAPPAAPTTA